MNPATQLIAQVMGPMAIVIGLSFTLKAKEYLKWFKHIDDNQPFLFLQGAVEASLGLSLGIMHNYWGSFYEILISLIAWSLFFEGSLALLTSNKSIKRSFRMMATMPMMYATTVVMVMLGIYLMWVGYYV